MGKSYSTSSTLQKDNRIEAQVGADVSQVQYDLSGQNSQLNNYFSTEVKEAMLSLVGLADKTITGTLATQEKLSQILSDENKALTDIVPTTVNTERWPLLVMLGIGAFIFLKKG